MRMDKHGMPLRSVLAQQGQTVIRDRPSSLYPTHRQP